MFMFNIAVILSQDELCMAAYRELETTDYNLFKIAMNTIQERVRAAVYVHSLSCEACAVHVVAQRVGDPITYCEMHTEWFETVKVMHTLDDAPVFQGEM